MAVDCRNRRRLTAKERSDICVLPLRLRDRLTSRRARFYIAAPHARIPDPGRSAGRRSMNRASAPQPHIVIAGAGPVGLTAALLLGHRGISVAVLEAEPALSQELRASTFHPPTLDLLAPYGITARMFDAGLVCPAWQIRLHPSGERAVFDLAALNGETDHPYRLQCEQSKYCEFVRAEIERLPTVALHFSTAVTALEQDTDAVHLRASSPDGERRFVADYTIGADGARSTVQRAVGIEMSGDIYPETTILATTRFPFHEKLEGLSNVSYCWKPDGTFSLLRLPGVWRASL